MARGKKKESVLTPEEKLAQALVPVEEQPYKVPENWCWTRIANLCSLSNGKAFKPTDWGEVGLPIVRIQNLNNPNAEYNLFSGIVEEKFRLRGNELLFAWSGTPGTSFGAHIWWGKEAVLNQHIFRVDFNETHINKIFFKYAINQQLDMLISVAHGGAGLQHVTKGVFEATPIPLPPLAEQKRIVDRIEYLFAKLDEAKEKAQSVLDSFETRKAAILHKAFTGKLTVQWRAEHGVNLDGWQQTTIGKESLLITKGASPRWQGITYTDDKSQTLFVTSENVRDGYLDLTKEKYLDNRINEIQRRSVLQKGDVLVNIVGASIGRAAIFDLECLANTNQAVCLIRLKGSVVNRFLCYYLNSPVALTYYGENKVETARANISLTNISDMGIALPSIAEQHEIIRILDSLFAKEQQAKEAAEAVLEKIDLLKKSILARAFRGELGTNDPTEESALELLREIIG